MRLLVITNDYPPKPGGIQQYLGSLMAAYPSPYLVLGPADGAASDEDRVRRYARGFMAPTRRVAGWMESEAASFEPEAILVGAPYPLATVGARLGRRFDVPVGILAHGAEITIPSAVPGLRQAFAAAMRGADVLFGTSRYTTRKLGDLSRRPVTRIGAGVDIVRFSPAEVDGRGPVPVIGCVSRFVPRKGQHRLLRAAARLAAQGTPVQVLLVGRGRKEAALRDLARELDVDVRFEVDVPWSEIPDLYREMDAFCMPCRSRWAGLEVEGLGLVFLEAAAAGIPVLAGDSGGSRETVVPGRTGFVVRSTADIVEALTLLIRDRELAAAMGRNGRSWVESEWTWDRTAERLIAGFARAHRG